MATLAFISLFCLQLGVIARVLLRRHREPASRIAWIVVIFAVPLGGIVAYMLLGETNIGHRRVARMRDVIRRLPDAGQLGPAACRTEPVPEPVPKAQDLKPVTGTANSGTGIAINYRHLFQVGRLVNGFAPVTGNQAHLIEDSDTAIDNIVADIDNAQDHVHLLFYIWLPDNNGCKVVEALKRAARRGLTCRVMADSLGSRIMIKSSHWRAMREAGVQLAAVLPVGNPLFGAIKGRVDLRNHRKIVVIDNRITYCGSQNCADPEFLIKAKYAPWVDALIRFTGPVARQNQYLFISDWMSEVDEDISDLLQQPVPEPEPGFAAQVIGTGPTVRFSAMPEIFESLMYAARHELVISTPYFVPDESMLGALCASARRGVATTIIFPARNDSWFVAAASRSYYDQLLAAGVRIFEYQPGLLHTKSLTLDGEVMLIGSANMDRRSFDLNYENNILLYDPVLTADMRRRQEAYIADSLEVSRDLVDNWSWRQRLWHNAIAMFSPVL